MSLSLALSSALSGLSVTARATQLASDNIANMQTEGYGVRTLSQAARVTGSEGSGVVATGIQRDIAPALLADLRHAKSQKSQDDTRSGFWAQIEMTFGMPDEPGGLTYLIDRLGVSLQNAAAQTDSDARLYQVAQATTDIAHRFGAIHDVLQSQRDMADSSLAKDVQSLNQMLGTIAELNTKIQRQTLLGGAPESLMDARQRLIDDVASIVAVQEIPRADGRILLLGRDGSVLVDRTAAQFDFTRTLQPDASDRVENGVLSAVTLNGRDVAPGSALFSTGRMGAFLEIRDKAAPALQQKLDNIAQDLVARFSAPAVDPTLAADAFGLFALNGLAGLPADNTGIAAMLSLNALADPEK